MAIRASCAVAFIFTHSAEMWPHLLLGVYHGMVHEQGIPRLLHLPRRFSELSGLTRMDDLCSKNAHFVANRSVFHHCFRWRGILDTAPLVERGSISFAGREPSAVLLPP